MTQGGGEQSDRGPQPSIPGARAVLRPWAPSDARDVYLACQDEDIQRFTPVPSPYALAHAEEFVTVTAPRTWADGGALFAVLDVASGELAASMGAHRVQNGVAEIGYWTRRESRGRGLTKDALGALTHWLFTVCDVARAELVIEPTNAASIGVAESTGYVREGLLRGRYVLRGRRADGLIYSLLPTDPGAARLG